MFELNSSYELSTRIKQMDQSRIFDNEQELFDYVRDFTSKYFFNGSSVDL
jgi:hypothetical protein